MNYEKSINFQVEGRKKSVCYSNCSLSKADTKGRLMAVNDKYLALAWKEIGMIKLVDLNNPNDQKKLQNFMFSVQNYNILDMEFSPFDNGILSFCNENINFLILKDEK